jgi:hypothetical protein
MERKSIGDVSMDVPEDIQEYQRKQELIGDGERVFAQIANPVGDADVYTLRHDPGDPLVHDPFEQNEDPFEQNEDARLALIAYVESLKAPNGPSPSQEEIDSLKRQLDETKKSAAHRLVEWDKAEEKVEKLKEEVAEINRDRYAKQDEFIDLRSEIATLKAALSFYVSR